jgi:hypothetical protein
MGLAMIKLKVSYQNIQDKGKMNLPNSVVTNIIILIWLVNGNLSNVPMGTRILILNIIGGWNHHKIPLVHEGRKGFWLEGKISINFHWPREIKSKRGQGRDSLELETFLLVGCVKCCMCCMMSVWEGGANWICVNVCCSWTQWCVQAKGTWKKIRCIK